MGLFEDNRARRVGDILTVQLVEQTDASKSSETTIEKDTTGSITSPTVLGSAVAFQAPPLLPLATTTGNNLTSSLTSSHSFDGSGESSQSNSINGEISVTVAEVLPNGNMIVRGEKLYSLNQGHEHIRISGMVRPSDIRSDNTILSTRVADARIIYGGEGATNDSNVIGWLARFFISALLPF